MDRPEDGVTVEIVAKERGNRPSLKRKGTGHFDVSHLVADVKNKSSQETTPVHTPRIEKVEVLRRGKVRQARTYYLRGLRGKAARIKEIRDR